MTLGLVSCDAEVNILSFLRNRHSLEVAGGLGPAATKVTFIMIIFH